MPTTSQSASISHTHDANSFDTSQPMHVRLYGRNGCSLCNDAARLLNSLHGDFDFWVERVNIDDDPAIREKLNDHIPVVTINGGNRVSEPVTEEKLRRAFKKAIKAEQESLLTENTATPNAEDIMATEAVQ